MRLKKSKADASQHSVLSFLSVCGFPVKWFHFHEGKHLGGTCIKHLLLDLKYVMASDSETKAEEPIFTQWHNCLCWKWAVKVMQSNPSPQSPSLKLFPSQSGEQFCASSSPNLISFPLFFLHKWEAHLNLTLASPNLSRQHHHLLEHFSRMAYPTHFPDRAVSPRKFPQ